MILLASIRQITKGEKGIEFLYILFDKKLTRDNFYKLVVRVVNYLFVLSVFFLGLSVLLWTYVKYLENKKQVSTDKENVIAASTPQPIYIMQQNNGVFIGERNQVNVEFPTKNNQQNLIVQQLHDIHAELSSIKENINIHYKDQSSLNNQASELLKVIETNISHPANTTSNEIDAIRLKIDNIWREIEHTYLPLGNSYGLPVQQNLNDDSKGTIVYVTQRSEDNETRKEAHYAYDGIKYNVIFPEFYNDLYSALLESASANDQGRERILVGALINFRFNSYELIDNGFLKLIGDTIITHFPSYLLNVRCHTDQTGTSDYNLHLSSARCNHIAKLLKHKGLKVFVEAFGESALIYPNDRHYNRRIEFYLSKETIT